MLLELTVLLCWSISWNGGLISNTHAFEQLFFMPTTFWSQKRLPRHQTIADADGSRNVSPEHVGQTWRSAAECKNRSSLFIHEKAPSPFRPDDVSLENSCTSGSYWLICLSSFFLLWHEWALKSRCNCLHVDHLEDNEFLHTSGRRGGSSCNSWKTILFLKICRFLHRL